MGDSFKTLPASSRAASFRVGRILPLMHAYLAPAACAALLSIAGAAAIAQSPAPGKIYRDAAESKTTVTTTTTVTTITPEQTTTATARSVDTATPSTPSALVSALKQGGYIVYFRHTATDFSQNDQNMKDFDDCPNQRNLTSDGRDQARKIGDAWKRLGIPVGRVLASPFCRTREVAQLAFGRYERALDVRGGPGTAGDSVRYQPLSKLLETPPPSGTNDVISSHGNPFRALHPEQSYLAEGEAAIIQPVAGGGHRVVGRIAWDQWPGVAR